MIKAVCAENLYKLLFSRSEIDHFITCWYSVPSTPRELGGSGRRVGLGPRGWIRQGVCRSCQALPAASGTRRHLCWCRRPGGASAAPAQPGSAVTVTVNLPMADAARELSRSRVLSQASAGGPEHLSGQGLPHPCELLPLLTWQPGLLREGRRLLQKVLSLPPQ